MYVPALVRQPREESKTDATHGSAGLSFSPHRKQKCVEHLEPVHTISSFPLARHRRTHTAYGYTPHSFRLVPRK